ncbi:MAG: PAS domain-containing protein [Methylomonas sp.]|jgi:PAS domain S-box-containing protein
MNKKWDSIERRKSLRAEADALVARFYPEHMAEQTPEKLLHELLVHKVELELQNEELRLAYASMQEMRDNYHALYESAPVGYFTVNAKGLIGEMNLTGTALFGLDRTRLIDSLFSKRIDAGDQDRWRILFMKMLASAKGEKQEVELTLKRADESRFHAHLECLRGETTDNQALLRIALSSINNLNPAEKACRGNV